LIGVNHDEGTLFAAFAPPISTAAQYREVLAGALAGPIDQGAVSLKDVVSLYPLSKLGSGSNAIAAAKGDQLFACGALETANALADGGAAVYFYHFTQDVRAPLKLLVSLMSPTDISLGTFHSSETPYVIGVRSILGLLNGSRAGTSRLMRAFWTNTAAYGSPNHGRHRIWPRYSNNEGDYLIINESPKAASGLKEAECLLWQAL